MRLYDAIVHYLEARAQLNRVSAALKQAQADFTNAEVKRL